MPAQQESWIATAYLESGTIAKGYVACLNAAGTAYVVASSANRTAAGRRSACIALTSADISDPGGSGFEAQYVGVVPPIISGLGAGSASPIRVSSAGLLERASFDSAEDMVGRCDADGTAYVCFPLIGLSASFGSAGAAAPTNSLQASNSDGTFRGLTHAFGSTDGYIEARSKTAGTQPTSGTIRGDDGGLDDADGWSLAIRMQDGETVYPLQVYSVSGAGAPWADSNWRWSQDGNYFNPTLHAHLTYRHYWWQVGVRGPDTDPDKFGHITLFYVPHSSPSPGVTGRRIFSLSSYVNFLMVGDNADPADPTNWEGALCNGEGVIALGKAKVEPTTSPDAGFTVLWPSRSNLHIKQRIGATVYDLTAPAAGTAGKIQGTDGSGVLTAPGPYVGADYISTIAGTPDAPGFRTANNTTFAGRNFGGTADIVACYIDSSNQVRVGSNFDATQTGVRIATPSGQRVTIAFGTQDVFRFDETEFAIDSPRHGYTSPYASEGQATFAVTLTAHTLTPTEWTRRILKFTGVLGGTSTITLPAPANADASYVKGIRNTSTSTLTLTKGSGTTASVAAGTDKQVLITPDGVFVA